MASPFIGAVQAGPIAPPTYVPSGSIENPTLWQNEHRRRAIEAAQNGLQYDPGSNTYSDYMGRSLSYDQAQAYLHGARQPQASQSSPRGQAAPQAASPQATTQAPQQGSGGLTGAAGGQPAPQQDKITSQDLVNLRAAGLAGARLQNQIKPQTSLADLFGVGGGDWASQWGKQADPRSQISNNFYSGLGLDTDLFNSASGPYGQLQLAAAHTAPARNDRQARMYEADTAKDIAGMKYGTAKQVLGQLANLMSNPSQMNGFETDYGASAMLKPTNLRRFF